MEQRSLSRRRLLLGGLSVAMSAGAVGRGTRTDSPAVELEDPLTGRAMERLTDPVLSLHLPHRAERILDDRGNTLYMAGGAEGELNLYAYDLRRERLTQVSEGPGLLSHSATVDSRGRTLYYIQGDRLLRDGKTLQEIPAGWISTGALTISEDGDLAAWVEMREGEARQDPDEQFARHPRCRLQIAPIGGGPAKTLAEEDNWLSMPRFRPGGREILYAHEGPWGEVPGRLQMISADGGSARSLRERQGEEHIGAEQWSADGSRIWFVHFPNDTLRGATVRTIDVQGRETTISPCSAFGWFQVNNDASAIVGASKRLSGPNIYVLFPKLKREITLCEHGWSGKPSPVAGSAPIYPEAATPGPILSRNSQWIYFSSAREGSPAVYRMKIEDLVSET